MCCGDDRPYETIYMLWEKEAQEKAKKNLQNNTQLKKKMTMQLQIPIDEDDAEPEELEKPRPKPPQTAVNTGKKFDHFDDVVPISKKSPTDVTTITFQEKSKYEYLMNRDPMQEFFTLTCYCLLYTSPSPRDRTRSRMPSSA